MALATITYNVKPLEGAITRPRVAGGTLLDGYAAYPAADGDLEAADANAAASAAATGIICAAGGTIGQQSYADGDPVTECVFGPVGGFTGLTPGATYWVSETTGRLTDTAPTGAGTWSRAMGYAESANVFFVMPGIEVPVSNS